MFGDKKPKVQRTIDTLIGVKTFLTGRLSFEGGLRIDGKVEGDVQAQGEKPTMLVISELAHVTGAVSAAHIIVNGTIDGPVYATELLELQPKARILGNVSYKALEMHNGAVVEGQLRHETAGKPDLKVVNSAAI